MGDGSLLVLVRHGETPANLEGVWHGSTDTPLTPRGLAQAERVAACMAALAPPAALYSSPLQRARHTAEAIGRAVGLAVRPDPDLAEYHLGEWEGMTYRDLHHQHRLWHHMKRDPDFAPHGGESPRRVTERTVAALYRIAAAHAGERIVVVGHGGALAMAFGAILDGSYGEWRRVMENCAVSELLLEPRPELVSFNRIDHLADL